MGGKKEMQPECSGSNTGILFSLSPHPQMGNNRKWPCVCFWRVGLMMCMLLLCLGCRMSCATLQDTQRMRAGGFSVL